MKKGIKGLVLALMIAVMPNVLSAAGAHDGITCLGCHSPHFAVDDKIFAVKNTVMKNPLTREGFDQLTAKNCLGCHELVEYGGAGIKPVHMHTTHPIGMVPNPKVASVPDSLLKNGMLDCVSCHEAHPSNPNFMYLRVDVGDTGANIQKFCAACHSSKADLGSMGINNVDDIKFFSAMDEEAGSGEFSRNEVIIDNKTPSYIMPLGKIPPNDIIPNYQNQPDWVYAPTINALDDFGPSSDTEVITQP
ncbi:MAG: cytochrome c3 family protein [Sulfurimonas sp.]|nr:cytochrome c3 family protein [Sulfurimonas sp.]